MTPNLTKREANRQRWFDRIEAWQQSGLSRRAFCEQQHLKLGTFQRWRGVFAKDNTRSSTGAVSFLPVNVTTAPVASLALVVSDQLRLEIPAGFDPETLQQVVQALQAP